MVKPESNALADRAELINLSFRNEIDVVRRTCNYRAFNFSFFFTASRFILLCTFLVFGFTGDALTAEKAFLVASMSNTVRLSMTLFFPFAISQIGEARVSIKRIQVNYGVLRMSYLSKYLSLTQDFLLLQERDDQARGLSVQRCDGKLEVSRPTVSLEKITGRWSAQEEEDTLQSVSLKTFPGQLLAIIGSVGAGKSSVIQAVLGEFPCSAGKISLAGKISYSPQESWVFSGSVRQNILFGKAFCQERYSSVISACALEHDLTQWEHGDRTLVGERGVSLSGGQKARVSLARAVYREADTYLLDDPLSAVDVHVGRHLFSKCIRGFLRDKAVILVTHQLQYLQEADEIIVLKNGKIEERGDFQHLVKNGMDFSAFLAQDTNNEEEVGQKMPRKRTRTFSTVSESHSIRSELSLAGLTDALHPGEEEEEEGEGEETKAATSPQQVKEMRSSGSVRGEVYYRYFTSGGGLCALIFCIVMNLLCQGLYSASDIWLSHWTTKEQLKIDRNWTNLPPPPTVINQTVVTDDVDILNLNVDETYDHYFNLLIYTGIVMSLVVASMIRTVHFFSLCMSSSVSLHNSVFKQILRAPCRFFDTNPVGRFFVFLSILS